MQVGVGVRDGDRDVLKAGSGFGKLRSEHVGAGELRPSSVGPDLCRSGGLWREGRREGRREIPKERPLHWRGRHVGQAACTAVSRWVSLSPKRCHLPLECMKCPGSRGGVLSKLSDLVAWT